MRGVLLYLATVLPFFALPLVLLPLGVAFEDGQAFSILALIVAGLVGTLYVDNVYLHQLSPRAPFFAMLVVALNIASAGGVWIGYLIARTRLEEWFAFTLPAPDQPVRSLLAGAAVVFLLATPVYVAVNIALKRREAREDV